jgi:hypothetical protein
MLCAVWRCARELDMSALNDRDCHGKHSRAFYICAFFSGWFAVSGVLTERLLVLCFVGSRMAWSNVTQSVIRA